VELVMQLGLQYAKMGLDDLGKLSIGSPDMEDLVMQVVVPPLPCHPTLPQTGSPAVVHWRSTVSLLQGGISYRMPA
jgi:hypothetical protein